MIILKIPFTKQFCKQNTMIQKTTRVSHNYNVTTVLVSLKKTIPKKYTSPLRGTVLEKVTFLVMEIYGPVSIA